jgi:predicted MFS family arabinose efflux permease
VTLGVQTTPSTCWTPYSFTHVLHGFLLCGLLALIAPRLSALWRLWLAVSIEALWELIENSEFVIRRYREQTAALGYHGDTIVNSLGDILVCGLGFVLAQHLGFRRAFAVFVLTEVALALWIRDNLTLNIVMLIHPIDAIKEWQAAGH